MPNTFTTTTTTGYGNRIINSIKGVVFGVILFIASFGLLYWNEGRVDLSDIAKTATEIVSSQVNVDPSLAKKLVSTTGIINSHEVIGDNLFLQQGTFIAVERKVEMYAWKENQETKTKTNTGGSETSETTYTYRKEWMEHLESSSNFQHPEEHENPQKSLDSYTNKVADATIGIYHFNPTGVMLPDFEKIPLNTQNTIISQGAVLANDSYLFVRKSESGTFENPSIGDLRVSYYALRSGFTGTIFGALHGNSIESYVSPDGNSFYRIFIGTREAGIATFHSEYTTMLWILRLVGFLAMWFGLLALFGPISVLLDVLPIFGSLSRSLIGIMTFLVSLVLAIVTILVSMLIHNFIALIIALAVTVIAMVIFVIFVKKKKKVSG